MVPTAVNISFVDQTQLRQISVLGSPLSAQDGEQLLNACSSTALLCEIHFFDASTLPAPLIEGLAALQRQGRKLRLIAYHPYALHHLSRLGLPVQQQNTPPQSPTAPPRIEALVLGGSADSLDGILYLVERLPVLPITVFIVQHVLEEQPNLLDRLLKMRTDYTVIMPTHLLPLEPATIYIAPSGYQMKVANGLVYLTRDCKVNFARPSLDVLFQSLAVTYGASLLAVLFCGYGRDGVDGCLAIRNAGGLVLAQQHEDCLNACMLPDTARHEQACNYSFSRAGLACFTICLLLHHDQPQVDEHRTRLLLTALNSRYGYDFSDYQAGTVTRRIDKIMRLHSISFYDLQYRLLTSPAAFDAFFVEMSINVTSFFRHPEQFRCLREEILPYLDSFPLIKIWSAGCATGEEPYSLAILLEELGMLHKSYIFATDINSHVLREAENGLFPEAIMQESREQYIQSGGTGSFDDYIEPGNGAFFKISPRLRQRMLFHQHSLVHDGVFNEFQLIICRNVLIYFNPDLSRRVMKLLANSLHQDGFLMFGAHEAPDSADLAAYFSSFNAMMRSWRLR